MNISDGKAADNLNKVKIFKYVRYLLKGKARWQKLKKRIPYWE